MRITTYKTELNDDKINVLVKEKSINYTTSNVLNNAQLVSEMLNSCFRLSKLAEEYVYMVALNTKSKALGVFEISHGTNDSAFLNPREIFIRLLLVGASHFIVAHNHPSGDSNPSSFDINITKTIKQCGQMMGIEFVDHIIIGDDYYSFNERGLL